MEDHLRETERQPADPRVRFAAERTLLAWMRTGLALMGFGFVVARFGLFLREIAMAGHVAVHQRSTGWSLGIGTGLIALGVLVSLAILGIVMGIYLIIVGL
jgi:putative membrane protein